MGSCDAIRAPGVCASGGAARVVRNSYVAVSNSGCLALGPTFAEPNPEMVRPKRVQHTSCGSGLAYAYSRSCLTDVSRGTETECASRASIFLGCRNGSRTHARACSPPTYPGALCPMSRGIASLAAVCVRGDGAEGMGRGQLHSADFALQVRGVEARSRLARALHMEAHPKLARTRMGNKATQSRAARRTWTDPVRLGRR